VETNVGDVCVGEGGAPLIAKINPALFSLPDGEYVWMVDDPLVTAFEVLKEFERETVNTVRIVWN
jgi:hypothetical protein